MERFSKAPDSCYVFGFPKTPDYDAVLFSESTRWSFTPSVFRKWPSAEQPLSGRSGCWGFNINSNGGGSGSVNSGSSSYRRLDEARNLQVSEIQSRTAALAILNDHKYITQTPVRVSMSRHRIAPLSLWWTGGVCVCCCNAPISDHQSDSGCYLRSFLPLPACLCVCVFISATSVVVQNNTARHPPHMAVILTVNSSLFKEAIKNLEFTSLGSSQCVSLDDLCKLIHLPSFVLVLFWLYKITFFFIYPQI